MPPTAPKGSTFVNSNSGWARLGLAMTKAVPGNLRAARQARSRVRWLVNVGRR